MNFDEWMQYADKQCERLAGLSLWDLPDAPLRRCGWLFRHLGAPWPA